MFLIYLATFSCVLAFLTGILAVGSGSHFQFTKLDLIHGRRDAILYAWVMISAIFSLAQSASLFDFGISTGWQYSDSQTGRWMAIHTGMSLMVTAAHLFIRGDLKNGTSSSTYLWGKLRHAG